MHACIHLCIRSVCVDARMHTFVYKVCITDAHTHKVCVCGCTHTYIFSRGNFWVLQKLPLTTEPFLQHPSLLPLPAELMGTVSSRIVSRQYLPGQAGQHVLLVPKVTLVFRSHLLVPQKRHLQLTPSSPRLQHPPSCNHFPQHLEHRHRFTTNPLAFPIIYTRIGSSEAPQNHINGRLQALGVIRCPYCLEMCPSTCERSRLQLGVRGTEQGSEEQLM